MGQCMEMGSLSRLKNATECGRKGPGNDNRIVGGVSVRENEIPWQVAILAQNGSWSGNNAILLSCDPVIVLTAAHCVTNPFQPQDAGTIQIQNVLINIFSEERPPTKNITLAFGAHKVSFVTPSPMDKNEVSKWKK